MTGMAKISVIIPNYNRATLVGETIENMLRQSLPPSEVIVVDDGSTDDSLKVIRAFGDRVKLVAQANQGPGAARNHGMQLASGDLIQFMDSDDLASLNKLEIQFNALKQSGADFAYCPWVRTEFSDGCLRFAGPVMQGSAVPGWKSMLEWQMGSWCLIFQNCLFRRTILDRVGKYRTDLMPSEDSEYLVRILLAGAKPVFTKECLVFYRAHGSNQITSSGTNAKHRALDWTRYFEVVGEETESLLASFHPTTRMEVGLIIRRHNRYCENNSWPKLDPGSPLCRLTDSIPPWRLALADCAERVFRRLSLIPGDTPNSRGLAIRKANEQDFRFARELGYEVASIK